MQNLFFKIFISLDALDTPYRKSLLIIFILTLLSTIFELLGIGLIVPIITIFVNDDYLKYTQYLFFLDTKDRNTTLQIIILVFTFVYFIKFIFMSYLAIKQNHFSHFLFTDISKKLFKKYLNQDYLFHTKNNSSVLIRNISSEANLFSFGVVYPVIKLVSELIIFVSICVLLLWYNAISSVIAILFFSTSGLILFKITSRKLNKYGHKRQFHSAQILKQLNQSFGNIKEIILYGLENFFVQKYHTHNLENAKAGRIKNNITELPRFILEFVGVLTFFTVILFLLKMNEEISQIFIIVGVFSFATIRLLPCVSKIVKSIQTIKFNTAVINLIDDELDNYEHEQKILQEKKDLKEFKLINFEKIKLNNVSFLYPMGKDYVLKNIEFEINKLDKIGIMGKSGDGKTTLLNLISGLLKCSEGEIKLNNENINNNLISWQRKIGYVAQSVYIADESVLFNITLEDDNKSDISKVNSILKSVGLYEYIYSLSNNVKTIVGERGGRLSGGQCQRLGIARALYRNPSIIILDEATSSLDEKTEGLILQSLFKNIKDKTIITVSHRKSSLQHCDKVFEVKDKSIREINLKLKNEKTD